MGKIIFVLLFVLTFQVFAQQEEYSIEYYKYKIGVFNPEKTLYHSLNPTKTEHITGYFRENLAKIIFESVKDKKVKIFDERKREISVESVIKNIIDFEKNNFNIEVKPETALDYAIKYIGAYDFEEAITYNYKNLSIEKKVLAYCPYMVRYKKFDENNDTLTMPLFWIFLSKNENVTTEKEEDVFDISDTIFSVLSLKYPVKMPFTLNLFYGVKQRQINVYQPNGREFKTMKEIDDLFVLSKSIGVYDQESGKDIFQTIYSDINPEDMDALRIGEKWSINTSTLEIYKKIHFFLPLYTYDENVYRQLGMRIYNNVK